MHHPSRTLPLAVALLPLALLAACSGNHPAASAVLHLAATAPSQVAPSGPDDPDGSAWSAVLEGRVVRAGTETPVVGATVRCQRPVHGIIMCATGWESEIASTIEDVITDDAGRFRFEFPDGLGLHAIRVLPTGETDLAYVVISSGDGRRRLGGLPPGESATVVVQAGPSHTLRGAVVNEAGVGHAGARVHAWFAGVPLGVDGRRVAPDRTVLTDADGTFSITGLARSTHLEAEADRWIADGRLDVFVRGDHVIEGARFTLHPERFIEGQVIDQAGQPLEAVRVQATRGRMSDRAMPTGSPDIRRSESIGVFTRTDADGLFRLGPLPTLEVEVLVPGAPNLPWSAMLTPGGDPLRIVLDEGAVLSGVVRGASGAPKKGAVVATAAFGGEGVGYGSRSVLTGEDGTFRFTGVPASESARVRITSKGDALQVVSGIVITPGGEHFVEVELEAEHPLHGRIVNPDGTPWAHNQLEVHGERVVPGVTEQDAGWRGAGFDWASPERAAGGGGARTDADGHFRIDGLSPGRHLLRAGQPAQLFSVSPDESPVFLQLSRSQDLHRRMIGRVFDSTTGNPVPGYDVNPQYKEYPDHTDRQMTLGKDRFVLELREERGRVVVGAPGYAYWVERFYLRDYWDYSREVPLQPARQLAARVLQSDGSPVSGVSVGFAREDGTRVEVIERDGDLAWGSARTDAAGKIAVARLPPELLTVTAVRYTGGGKSEPVGEWTVDLRGEAVGASVELVVGDG